MAYRFSDTLKWSDSWFIELNSIEKLLFLYLCDNCDIGGFFELSLRKISFDLGCESKLIEEAIKGLQRGLIISDDESCVLVKNFIKHQKNLPLNIANKSHKGIFSRYNMYAPKFIGLKLDPINGYINKGASKGLQRGTGIGIGNDIDKDNNETNNILDNSDFLNDDILDEEPIVLLDEIDFKNKKSELIDLLINVNGFNEEKYTVNKRTIMSFVNSQLITYSDIDHFTQQYQDYKEYKKISKESEHNFTGYFGTQAMQFSNGAWNSENWGLKLQQYKLKNNKSTKFSRAAEAYNGATNPYETK